ncbi:MAG: hypothetical protein M9918_11830 [Anaerolineae bacterium]|nr:hypothetical protein [Anaerolineae bacterium]MCO5195936.1 hypothetical protein [Anaerolineae bacterium]
MTPQIYFLERALKRIYTTGSYDIQCNFAGELMARCIDAGLDLADAQRQYPELKQHFSVCSDCVVEYQIMSELSAQQTAADDDVLSIKVPPRPDLQGMSLWPRVKAAVATPFAGFAPQTRAALARGADLDVEPVEVALGDSLTVELDVGVNERDASMRDLFCTVSAENDQLEQRLEGSSTWILTSADAVIVQESTIDEMGSCVFERLHTDQTYALLLHIAGQHHIISDIRLP